MKILNRKINREYEVFEKYQAGIVLSGSEVKSVRQGGLRLENSFIKFLEDGPYLINAEIPKYRFSGEKNYDPKKSRKILLNKDEILKISTKIKSSRGLTIVPTSCYNKGVHLKLEIALVRGRKEFQKRKFDKKKEISKRGKREVKEYLRG
jgi:SsrA-binding protein